MANINWQDSGVKGASISSLLLSIHLNDNKTKLAVNKCFHVGIQH